MTQFITSFILLSLLGIFNSGYLVYSHYKKKHLVCPTNGNCNAVTESKWSSIFLIRNDILGIFFYLAMLISIFLFLKNPSIKIFIQVISGLGVLFSLFLIYIQAYVIKKYCFYCLISSLLTLLIFLNSFLI